MSFTSIAVTGTVYNADGSVAVGATVSLKLSTAITDGATDVLPAVLSEVTSSNGTFTFSNVVPNDDSTTTPAGTYYRATVISSKGQMLDAFNVVIPHSDAPTVDLFSLTRVNVASQPAITYGVTELLAGTGVTVSESGQGVATVGLAGSVVNASGEAANLIPKADGSNGVSWANSDLSAPVFYVADYGTITYGYQNSVDNATVIQDAINAAEAWTRASQGAPAVVQLPAGPISFQTTLTITSAIWLRGVGIGGSVLYAYWGSQTTPNIELTSTATGATLSDFRLGVNKSSAKSTAHGIQVDGQGGFASSGGSGCLLQRLWIATASGDGVNLQGIEQRLIDVYVQAASGNGFTITGTDNMVTNCTADTCAGQGFTTNADNTKYVGCKAFGGSANGWNIGGQRNMFAACEAQDNDGYGFNMFAGSNTLVGCLADTNGRSGGTQYGFYFNDDNTAVGCVAINRTGSYQTYSYGARATGSPGVSPSSIHGSSQYPGTNHVDPASVGAFNINNYGGAQTISYSSSITPDPFLGSTIAVAPTGAMTINATSYSPYTGQRITFEITQDSTGRTITWNSVYKPLSAIPTTPSSLTTISFVFDGTYWQETSRSATLPAGTIVGTTDTQTLSNKRNTVRVVTVTQAAAPSIDTDNMDVASITGLAQAITSMSTNLTGSPNAGDSLIVEITDNGTARAITWGSSFASTTVSLPTTTVVSTLLRVGFRRDAGNSVWSCVAVA